MVKFKKFKRGGIPKENKTDLTGRIRIQVTLWNKGTGSGHTKGNISKSLTILDAKVSEVYESLVDHLFKE